MADRDFSLSLPWDCQDIHPCLWCHLSNPKYVTERSAGLEVLKAKLINNYNKLILQRWDDPPTSSLLPTTGLELL